MNNSKVKKSISENKSESFENKSNSFDIKDSLDKEIDDFRKKNSRTTLSETLKYLSVSIAIIVLGFISIIVSRKIYGWEKQEDLNNSEKEENEDNNSQKQKEESTKNTSVSGDKVSEKNNTEISSETEGSGQETKTPTTPTNNTSSERKTDNELD